MSDLDIVSERVEDVDLFNCLPAQDTTGTSYDYFVKFPNFDEELYYMLECATRENADPEEVVKVCQEVLDARNNFLVNKFENTRGPYEQELLLEEILEYKINDEQQN